MSEQNHLSLERMLEYFTAGLDEYELEMIKKTGTVETSMIVEGSLFRLEKQKELINVVYKIQYPWRPAPFE